ncbi:MAG: efflux RND transporter periplasmic adaptor subunit [Pirellulaceae bacterium]|nr:efflux RND transporter periplasmic adaptor subunit [Planctomycetales bacterium]
MNKKQASGWRKVVRLLVSIATFVLGIAVMVVTIAWLSGAFVEKIPPGRTDDAPKLLAGRPTDVVHEVTKDYIEEAVGTLKAASRTVISSKVMASIQEIDVTAGDEVAIDDVLVKLDSKELTAKLRQAEQAHAAAVANQREAEVNHERMARLVSQRAASRSELDEATRRLDVTRAEVLRAEQGIAEAKVMVSYATIRAPKSGRIVDRLAEPGDMARPGEPLLVIYDATSLRLEAPVPEHLAVQLQRGRTLNVYIDALDREFPSTIDEIVPQADAPSRSFLVKASLPKSDDLYEGMFGRLMIPAGQRRHLCLDTTAIHRVGQLEFVEVVAGGDAVERRYIKTGRLGMPGRIEVLSGLKAGERVVVRTSQQPEDTSESHVSESAERPESARTDSTKEQRQEVSSDGQ